MQSKKQISIKRIQPTSFAFSKDKQLGKGTFGQVYLGFDQQNKCAIAVKTISWEKINNAANQEKGLLQKIAGEMRNMQLARSDRLVRLISPNQSLRNAYLVCEYCNGGSLKQYLKKKGTLAQSQAMSFFKDILQGFKCLHQRKIVHRDLKPANILLHNRRIKIGDLGFSKSIQIHQQILTSIVGSPLYMSPQILENSAYTEKTDLWSLGIILYEMLIGEAPWRVNSIQQIKQKVKHKLEFPKNCFISQPTRQLILSMLEYEQKNRVQWQTLFKQYLPQLSPKSMPSQMKQQSQQIFDLLHKIHEHFTESISIQSQNHINYILEKNNKKIVDFTSNCLTVRQFFEKLKQIKNQEIVIQPIINYYVENRNKIAYLMKLFIECYEKCEQFHQPIIYTTMLMLIKYSIDTISHLLTVPPTTFQHIQTYTNSYYHKNFTTLLQLDSQLLTDIFHKYLNEILFPKINQYKQKNIYQVQIEEIQKYLQPFFDVESASPQYTQFWLQNSLKKLFNQLKQLKQLPQKYFLLSRMIYQFLRSQKTNIFINQGQKSNLAKKLQQWKYQQKWKWKIKDLELFFIQNVINFIYKTISIHQLTLGGFSFGSNFF